jgi:hypothetical protein
VSERESERESQRESLSLLSEKEKESAYPHFPVLYYSVLLGVLNIHHPIMEHNETMA